MLEKGAEIKRNFENVKSELQAETELIEVNPKRLKTLAFSEQAQLLEAWTKEKLISSISIRKKEERLVQECSVPDIAVQESFVKRVICLSSAHIESHDMNVEEDVGTVMTTVVSSILNIQTCCSMVGT